MSEPLVKIDVLNISANTPASMLTVPINISRLRKLITYIGIERVPQSSGNATGTVELYARWEAAMGFSKIATVDLGASAEVDIQTLDGRFPEIKVVPINLVGAFNFTIRGF